MTRACMIGATLAEGENAPMPPDVQITKSREVKARCPGLDGRKTPASTRCG